MVVTFLLTVVVAKVTGTSADYWLGLQQDWDLWHALHSDTTKEIELLEPLRRVG